MTQFGNAPANQKPQPNVYTVLLVIAIIVMIVAVAVCFNLLTSPVAEGGYGLEAGQLLDPLKGLGQPGTN